MLSPSKSMNTLMALLLFKPQISWTPSQQPTRPCSKTSSRSRLTRRPTSFAPKSTGLSKPRLALQKPPPALPQKTTSGGQPTERQQPRPVNKEKQPLPLETISSAPLQPQRRFRRATRQRFALRKRKAKSQKLWQTIQQERQEAAVLELSKLVKVKCFYMKHFGFFSTSRCVPKHNASLHLSNLPAWYYFQRPTSLTPHNLCTVNLPPPNFRSLLGLGLNFCPQPPFSTKKAISDSLNRFRRDLYNRYAYAGETSDYDPMLYARSNSKAPEHLVASELKNRIDKFSTALQRLFRK